MKNLLISLGILVISTTSSAQQIAKGFTAANGQWVGFLEYKPTNYSTDLSTKYPLIIFLHGIGERGDGTTQIQNVAANGIPKYIKNGNPMRFYWNGKWETFIVLSPQLGSSHIEWQNFYVEELLAYAKANLRIDTNRIILTGLSLGGGGTWRFASATAANAQNFAALGTVCGTCSSINIAYIAAANNPLWAFHATNDPTVGVGCTTSQVATLESFNPATKPIMTLYSSGGHAIWDRAYDSLYNYQNPNIYEWFLAQDKSKPANILPVARAGNNITISTSTGMVNLSGAGSTDADGTILRYIWRKVSGPAAGTIATPVSTTGLTSVTGLSVAGTYVYEVKAVDDRAGWTTSNVTITVTSSAVSNLPPVTRAGNDLATTSSTTSLNGTGTYDPDGSISAYQWTKIAGPDLYTISNTNVASPNLTFLMIGDYTFELRATDNAGASTKDTVTIRSSASILPVYWDYVTAQKTNAGVDIKWSVNGQINNKSFDVLRSNDGTNFETIATIDGAGTSIRSLAYRYIDNTPVDRMAYYKIRQNDFDGRGTMSAVVLVKSASTGGTMEYFPNPARDQVQLILNDQQKGVVNITLYNTEGKVVLEKQIIKDNNSLNTTLPLQQLPKGVYMVKARYLNGVQQVMKLVKG